MKFAMRGMACLFVMSCLAIGSVAAKAAERTKVEIIKLVLDSFRANYAPVKTIQATVTYLMASPPLEVLLPKLAEQEDAPAADPAPPPAGGATLQISQKSRQEIRWSVAIAGANERYAIDTDLFHKTILRRGVNELEYSPPHYANLNRLDPARMKPEIHYDPRQAVLHEQHDAIELLLTADRVRSAEIVPGADGDEIARIEASSLSPFLLVIECPKSNSWLPTRVFHLMNDEKERGVIAIGAVAEYGEHRVGEATVRFPRRVVSKFAGWEKSRQTEGYMKLKGQEVTLTVTRLKLNAPLDKDVFRSPPVLPGMNVQNTVGPDRHRIPAEF